MTTKMPVAASVQRMLDHNEDEFLVYDESGQHGVMPAVAVSFRRAVFFDVQIAHEIFHAQWKAQRLADPCTFLAKAPYPATWLEWRDELTERYVGCLVTEPDSSIHAAMVEGTPLNQQSVFLVMMTLLPGADMPRIFPIEGQTFFSETGEFRETSVHVIGEQSSKPLAVKPDTVSDSERIFGYYNVTVLNALGLINCRNVTASEKRIRLPRNGTQKRRRVPVTEIRYNTIVLPGNAAMESDGKGGHRVAALHKVRGHFKTFTADKPLLGKHVGTYWWGWQMRGSAERGQVVSDYRLDAAAR